MSAWDWLPLGEVCKAGSGATPLRTVKEYYHGGTIPWLLSGEVAQGEITEAKNFITESGLKNSAAKLFPENSVLIAMYGATAGQVGILRFKAATNQAVCAILPNPRFVPEFLFYVFLHLKDDLVATATGNAQPNISQIKIKNTLIPVPPIEEQRRIVAVLDEAFAAIAQATANAEKNLANARELFASTIEGMLEQAAGCRSMSLLDAADENCSLSYGIVQPGEEQAGGLPIVRPTDLQQKFIGLGPLKRIDPLLASGYQRTTLRGDDLLLCVRGTTGTLSIATPELAGGNVTRGIVPIRFNPKILSQELGYFLLLSASAQKQIKSATYGAALMQINIRDLKQLELRIPPLADQGALADRLDATQADVEQLQANYADKIDVLTALKQSLLHRAFTGDLATTPDLAPKELLAQ